MSTVGQPHGVARSELAEYWRVVAACFAAAVFGWGFGFTGPSIYLSELHRLRGWPTAQLSSAITLYYMLGALCLTCVHRLAGRFGPARLLAAGVVSLGLGASLFATSQRPWQTFVAAGVMAVGWAGCTSTAIAASIAAYFQRQRGLAVTIALNGASAAGFIVGPALVALSLRLGFAKAVPLAAAVGVLVVVPLIWFAFPGVPLAVPAGQATSGQPDPIATTQILRRWSFWSVALPFALALAAQVGLIVHLISILQPVLGPAGSGAALAATSFAAMSGRLMLTTVVDRLPPRPAASVSIASQASGLLLIVLFPNWPLALYAGCIVFGLSVGNVITYPALIVHREFQQALFSRVVGLSTAVGQFTFSLSPALLGLIHDTTQSYVPALFACIGLQAIAATLVVVRPRQAVVF